MIWTRALVLEAMGFDFLADTRHALKRVREARDAKTGMKPDHRIRLEAAKLTFDLAGVKPRDDDPVQDARPIAVTVNLGVQLTQPATRAIEIRVPSPQFSASQEPS